jgi:hypothetical protein
MEWADTNLEAGIILEVFRLGIIIMIKYSYLLTFSSNKFGGRKPF